MKSRQHKGRNDPVGLIKKIARAIGVKVKFGQALTRPGDYWCQFEGPPDCNFHFDLVWGESKSGAATKMLDELCRQCWVRLPRASSGEKTNTYFQVFPTLDGYQIICAGTPITVEEIK